jgi:DNA-binding NtrC family response regulator
MEHYPPSKGRILLIDVDNDVRGTMATMLTRSGYTVTSVTSPVEAMGIFTQAPKNFDVLIIDDIPLIVQDLPISGTRVVSEITAMRPDMPVIVLSGGLNLEKTTQEAGALHVKELVMKPVLRSEIEEAIQRVVDSVTAKAS